MRVLELIAPALLALTAVGFSTHVVSSAQAPELECTQFLNMPDDGTPLAVELQALASEKSILRKQSLYADRPIRPILPLCFSSAGHFP